MVPLPASRAHSRWWSRPLSWLSAASLIKELLRGYKDGVVHKTVDELRSLTGISELNATIIASSVLVATVATMVAWRNGCVCGGGGDGPCALTFARERASSGKSQGVRVSPPRLAL